MAKKLGKTLDFSKELIEIGGIYVDKKRIQADLELSVGQYIRAHTEPKRYSVKNIKWKDHIVFQNQNFLIMNKPWGLPVHPTVDNAVENVVMQMSKFLSHPVHTTQRLDVVTRGLFLVAKTKEYQAQFNSALAKGVVQKEYWVLTREAPHLAPV